ncbi:hypothetical protein COJ85_32015 [Bacillus sp. AFS076308]|uniref:DUF3862 domain-containing protein n=1 Tax=unclassified Bacillus (in: firmicutes) TaxID=185979 RepID=UPI000BF54CE7|nr:MULTISPECIES: DUF3862 domain-containing protein [unclassified Bacillus (in: firmicutes)]PFN77596.1 hypothetical protein COJ85_32015 [Bacillus sp. AFS076308]PGV45321.1 hypothetical protein COD92_30900 [Bacillus sp. AFS037270]
MKKLSKLLAVGVIGLGIFIGVGSKTEAATTVTKPVGSSFLKSALYGDTYKVQDATGKTVTATITQAVTLKSYTSNNNFSYATVSFVDYDKVDTKWVKYTKTATGYFFTPIKDGITYNEYTNVKKGMTYNQVVSITGETMHLDSTYRDEYSDVKDYSWSKETDTSDMNVYMTFDSNKLEYKSFYMSEY